MEGRLRIEYVETSALVPYAGNAKQHPREQIDQIKASIEQFGMNDPIAVWRGNEIIEGHGRLLACLELGIATVPVIRLDDLTDEERRAYMNVHNQLTMNTGFDLDVLAEELRKITTIDMALFGFDTGEEDEGDLKDDDFTKAPPEEAKSKEGELYRLGDHYLLVGDSTKPEDVEKLMGGGGGGPLRNGSSIQRLPGIRERTRPAAFGSESAAPETGRADHRERLLEQR